MLNVYSYMKTIFFIAFVFSCFVLKAQSITPAVHNCGNADVKTGKVRYSFVVGQSFVAVSSSRAKAKLIENNTVGRLYASAVAPAKGVKSSVSVRLYPNPAADHVKITINNISEGQIFKSQMLDMMGRVLAQIQSSGDGAREETVEFDVSSYAPGQYLFRTFSVDDAQNAHVFKVVKIPN